MNPAPNPAVDGEKPSDKARSKTLRMGHVDVARGIALLAMATYHFSWDLEFFGYLEPGTANTGLMKIYARCIASSFLILAGMSLYWAHGRGFSKASFIRRLLKVGGAALLITAATWLAMPDSFIFFGILHQIALASVLGLAFLRMPVALTFVVAAAFIAAPHFLRNDFFNSPWLYWVGLSTRLPLSNDYVPLFPWFGAVLGGIGLARMIDFFGWRRWLSSQSDQNNAVYKTFAFAGRHSLATYLIHQPLLIALVWSFAQIAPAAGEDPALRFVNECTQSCLIDSGEDEQLCTRYCGCMMDSLTEEGLLVNGQLEANDADYEEKLGYAMNQCSAGLR